MLRNFIKTAIRNLLKYKVYAGINFIGLTAGMSLALLILTYVRHELSYDKFHEKSDRLYRLAYIAPNGLKLATSPPPIAPSMKEFFPEVEDAARLYGRNVSISIPGEDQVFEESNVFFADSALMNMFTFDYVQGSSRKPLVEPFTVIITEEMAEKYFGDRNPVGESLVFSGRHLFKVTAVVKEFPENSHVQFNMLAPYHSMFDIEAEPGATILKQNLDINFVISHSYTYVLLKPGASPKAVDDNMEAFLKKYANPQFLVGQVFNLLPVEDIHLKSDLLAEPSPVNNMSNLFIFIGVGILTLLIACINYINLSTAQSFSRLKEIGIRKILGSQKVHLILQFIAESFVFCLGAMLLSFAVFYYALPFMNQLLNKHLVFAEAVDGVLMLGSFVLLLLVTILAGGYPAYFVSRFESVNVLKGSGLTQTGGSFMRNALVVFQLTIACMLLSGALLIVKQLRFLENRPLGFQKEMVVNVPLFSNNLNGIFRQNDSTFRSKLEYLRQQIESQSGVRSTTLSSNAPGLGAVYRGTIPEGFTQDDHLFVANMSVDFDFLETYGMELAAGRTFDESHGTDIAEAFMVNESAVREFNWESPENAIGKTINREGKEGKVIGVLKDFNFSSLTTPVSALLLDIGPNQFSTLSVKFEDTDIRSAIPAIETIWNETFPEKAFEYVFLDEQLTSQYANFQNFGSIVQVFTVIAILISCLGVYGLVLFVVQRKVKEIGVRKVLGATELNILRLICVDFLWLTIAGFLLAIPLSYYFLSNWLENFTYRTSIDPLSYLISLIIVVLVVGLTIGYKAFKASLANPVDSLRSE